MKKLFAGIADGVRRAYIKAGYERARVEMLGLSDRLLADVGVSRQLLEQGVDAWPWRVPAMTDSPITVSSPVGMKPAIEELRRYNDSELNELGVARSQIETVVLHGRKGIDTPHGAAA